MYRTILGIVLQAGQQLTGANFLFYYGTTIFSATGLSNSYVTQIILGSVNVGCTFLGLWVAAKCGRRKALMAGAAWSFMCFLIYALVGHFQINNADPSSTPTAGNILIVFSCLFIVAFATTWGPLVWAIVAELYPARYRAQCMALATASNWLWNFLTSLFTQLIVQDIHWLYGLVFSGCSFALFFVVYFFLIESKDRSLEGMLMGTMCRRKHLLTVLQKSTPCTFSTLIQSLAPNGMDPRSLATRTRVKLLLMVLWTMRRRSRMSSGFLPGLYKSREIEQQGIMSIAYFVIAL